MHINLNWTKYRHYIVNCRKFLEAYNYIEFVYYLTYSTTAFIVKETVYIYVRRSQIYY